VLMLMSSGVKDEAAARQLNVSDRTYRRHVADILSRLGASSRFQAGVEAVRRGWL
jgi:DNA-binding NarL/FixJ family response regulator